jgi:hypothetical protein
MKSLLNKISKIPASKQDMDIMLNHLNDKCAKHMAKGLLIKYPGLAKPTENIKESWVPFESESGLCDIDEAMRQPEFINDVLATETFLTKYDTSSSEKILFSEPKSEHISPKQLSPTPQPVIKKSINSNVKRPTYCNPVDKDKLLLSRINNTPDDTSTKSDIPKARTKSIHHLARNKKLRSLAQKSVIKPVTEPPEDQCTGLIKKLVTEPTREPDTELAKEPVIEQINEPVIEPVKEPVIELAKEPVVEPAKEPVVELVKEPIFIKSSKYLCIPGVIPLK